MKKDKSIFAEALQNLFIPEILNESLPLDYEHEFSDEFERRMIKDYKKTKTRGGQNYQHGQTLRSKCCGNICYGGWIEYTDRRPEEIRRLIIWFCTIMILMKFV